MLSRVLFSILLASSLAFQYSKQSDYYQDNTKNIDIQISYIDAPLINIHWCGDNMENDNTVLALTSKGSVYRSDDKGRQWVKMSELFHRKALMELETQDEKVGSVNNIVVSPVDPDLVIFTGTENISWISLDCGKSISVISSGKQLREFSFHPTQKDWVLATSWNRCGAEQQDQNCNSYKELLISEDFGQTWHLIASYIHQFSWGVKSKSMLKYVPKERVLASFEPSGKGHQSLSSWNMEANLYYSDDFFQTRTLSVPAGARFLLTESFLFVAKVTNTYTQEVSLLVSSPANPLGYNYDIIDADQKLKEHSYSILDTSESQVFMIVNHFKPSSPVGVIYISDSTGTRYSRSLEYAVRIENNAEFYRVLGLEGIYLSNVYATEQVKIWEKQVFEQQESGFYMSGQTGFKDDDLKKYKQSRITFDKGGQWHPLKPPTIDCEGKAIKCDPKNCALHLHLNQQQYQFGPIYSQNNSIGIIVATGSIGKYLSYRPDQVNTYITRDGGLTWNEIHKGSNIYEISDHGGLILMASDQEVTTKLAYSWNEGMNWNVFQFADDSVEVQNIITEPTNRAERFIVYGSTKIMSNDVLVDQGILVTIDLDRLHQRSCYGLDIAGEVESDFELWTPSGIVNPDCLFGKKVTYKRRKRESACYNPEVFDRIVQIESCPCSAEDYECDLGFVFSPASSSCLPINGTLDTTPPSECSSYYNVTSGYRKIAGDMCKGGIQHPDLRLPCPGNYSGLIDYLLIFLLGGAIYWLYINQEMVKNYFKNTEQQSTSQNTLTKRLMDQLNQKKAQQQKNFKPIDLEENEQGLGQQDFDEDLLERNEDEIQEPKLEQKVEIQQSNDQLI